MEKKSFYKITAPSKIMLLFGLCWIVYFCTYLGRLNYSASLTEIIGTEGFSKGEAGLIGTGFFFAYGIGQLISGFLGDHLSPKWMIFGGMVISGFVNLGMSVLNNAYVMTIVWCANGLAQAFIWSPMIRLLYEYLKTDTRLKACLYLNSTVPIGTMAAYGITAVIISKGTWRNVFLMAAAVLILIGCVWLFGMTVVEQYAKKHGEIEEQVLLRQEEKKEKQEGFAWKTVLISSGLLFLMGALIAQGALKDGVTTWIPTYINETYEVGSITAILSTMVIPIFNLVGVYLASVVNQKWGKGEIKTAGIFFVVCAGSLSILWGSSGKSLIISLLMLAFSTTAMMAVNTMLIAVLPSRFGVIGKASSISGILNSSVYIGGAISTYGIGALSNAWGWSKTIFLWLICAVIAAIICFAVFKSFDKYRKENLS